MSKIRLSRRDERTAISVRWLFLLVITLWSALSDSLNTATILILSLAAMANITLTIFVEMRRLSITIINASILSDMLVAYLLFWFNGTLNGNLVWVGILPVATAALHYQLLGTLFAAIVSIIAQGMLAFTSAPLSDARSIHPGG